MRMGHHKYNRDSRDVRFARCKVTPYPDVLTSMGGFNLGLTKKEKLSPPAPKPTALVDAVTAPPSGTFGIRNYIHQFYQSPTVEDIETSGAWYLLPPPPAQRRGLYICRLLTVVGLLMLIGGAGAIAVGYTWPHEALEDSIVKIAIYQDDDGNFYVPPEKLAEILKDPMRHWKMTGFCVFAFGTVVMALGLLIPTCASCIGGTRLAAFASEDATPNEPPIRIYPAVPGRSDTVTSTGSTSSTKKAPTKISPTSGPVPVMEEIAKVQPEAQKEADTVSADDLLIDDSDKARLID
ncbi:hypothetical protein QR680_007115 [Steinernema hermaphroditum]|uniref:Transmembrane protein n=1 Tax=Steinernema hermaphroditum TaxID=289476 RepID=A0AA39LYA0_9BILA|nr:hypothetical protein QR680_007115 [Steinernema hermaphroditum]